MAAGKITVTATTPTDREPEELNRIFRVSVQADFPAQKCALEEEILNASRDRAVGHSWQKVNYLQVYSDRGIHG
jgi:hypothetical protein